MVKTQKISKRLHPLVEAFIACSAALVIYIGLGYVATVLVHNAISNKSAMVNVFFDEKQETFPYDTVVIGNYPNSEKNALKTAIASKEYDSQIETPQVPSTVPKTAVNNPVQAEYIVNNKKTDLAARILAVGVFDGQTGDFYATPNFSPLDRIAVKFEIVNLGTAETGSWYYSAVLPTFPMRIYESGGDPSLLPGEKAVFTLGFDNAIWNEEGTIVINADSVNSISEISEENNIAKITIFPK